MAVQEAISAFGPAWIARSFQTSWRAAGSVAHTKIEVSVNAYAVEKVQEDCSSHLPTARFFVQNDTPFLIVHEKFTIGLIKNDLHKLLLVQVVLVLDRCIS